MALAMFAPVAASAQTPRNPFADLFGRAPERTGQQFTAIQFRSNVVAQIGQTLEQRSEVPVNLVPEGWAGGASAGLTAKYMRDRVQLVGQGRYSYQEYRTAPAFGTPAFDGAVRADVKVTTRLSLFGGAGLSNSPFFQLMWLTADQAGSMAPADRSAIVLMRNDTIDGSGGFISRYTNRSSIELSGKYRETNFELNPELGLKSVGAHAMWKRQMTRDLAFRAGYGREQMTQQTPEGELRFVNELLDIGIDYAKALTIARRTSLSFGTQTSIIKDELGERHYRLNGSVRLSREFGRSWQVVLAGRRGTDLLPGFRAPVRTDHGSLTVAGYVAKRLALNLEANGGSGEVGFNDSRKFISYTGHSKLTFAVTRHLGVFGQYGYYHYQNPPDALTLFLVPRVARQAVSFGVQTWLSIYEKDKVIRDPR